ncbi:MAG: GNAT family N-acetyltransferase [Dehalococcoidia bacterium]|nr:GNAT family N-acetyltransferase [Dehalococcoidia bacterium]
MSAFHVRAATPDDAAAVAAIYARQGHELPGAPATPGGFERLIQTGHAFLVAERTGHPSGAVRWWDDDGIAWLDLLVAAKPGAGPALIHAVERRAQDRGLRLARMRVPETGRISGCLARWGYLPISRERGEWAGAPEPLLVLEKRLALLTVREQRRSDAPAIGMLTGEDPWTFEQGARPGWFVAADGDRIVGVISVRDAGAGLAHITEPVLRDGYGGRNLDAWMVDRCATYAETHGYHTAELPLAETTRHLRRALEDRSWDVDGARYIRRFRNPTPDDEH